LGERSGQRHPLGLDLLPPGPQLGLVLGQAAGLVVESGYLLVESGQSRRGRVMGTAARGATIDIVGGAATCRARVGVHVRHSAEY
jgi:hypothetical protein